MQFLNKMNRIADIIQFICQIPELIQIYRQLFDKNLFEVPGKKLSTQDLPNT